MPPFVLAQTRPPDELLVINNASTDETGAVARQIPGVRVVDEPRKGLVVARETGRREATRQHPGLPRRGLPRAADLAGAHRAPLRRAIPALIALSGPYRFYDWDWWGRLLIRAYDFTLAPATQLLVKHVLRLGTIFYGGNFAVRREALERDRRLRHHDRVSRRGHQPRPAPVRASARSTLNHDCYLYTSARRYRRDGEGRGDPALRAQLHLRAAAPPPEGHDAPRREALMPATNRSCSATSTSTRAGATAS